MGIIKEVFGHDSHGEKVYSYTVTNEHGTRMRVIEIGAALQSLEVADRDGNFADVVLGFDNVEQYEKENGANFGAVVGRNANRIKNGHFVINGKEYQLAINDGRNNLHSGPDGYSSRKWSSEIVEDERGLAVRFSLISPDGDQGMPGELHISAMYVLTEDDSVILEYEGVAGEDTIVNPTNHSYFNLSGDPAKPITDQELTINASNFTPVDSTFMTTGEILPVEGTPMDFRNAKVIGADIERTDYEQISNGKGFDHNWVLDTAGNAEVEAASVYCPSTGILLQVYTNEPGIQIYTGNFLDGTVKGKGGIAYVRNSGVALETQHYPDSPNKPQWPSAWLEPGQTYTSHCVYKFGVEK